MVTIRPARRALVPVDSAAARRVSAPNYDEFQGDDEIRALLAGNPDSILAVTMPHCSADGLAEGSPEALDRAAANLERLRPLFRAVERALWVYEIEDHQIGLGGMALTAEIGETIIRNEQVREPKARGRADLIERTRMFVGAVNHAVEDGHGELSIALKLYASLNDCDFEAADASGRKHKVWLVDEPERFTSILAREPCAYVADGNHRSAAAALLGCEEYLGVFFPLDQMRIRPYNRLVKAALDPAALEGSFEVEARDGAAYQPEETHAIGLYVGGRWYGLRPRDGAFDPADAAASIDADIVQRHVFAAVCGIEDPRDPRLNFVGGDRDAAWLQARVDGGDYGFAVTLPPVTMRQFADVCRQGKLMPPKSTWFEPKVRSGLVLADLA